MEQDPPQICELCGGSLAHANKIVDEYVESAEQPLLEIAMRNCIGQVRVGGCLGAGGD
jgi:hypothetical protein